VRHFLPSLQHFLKADQIQILGDVVNTGPSGELSSKYPVVLERVQFPGYKRSEQPDTQSGGQILLVVLKYSLPQLLPGSLVLNSDEPTFELTLDGGCVRPVVWRDPAEREPQKPDLYLRLLAEG